MKKTFVLLVMLSFICVFSTACTNQTKPQKNMIQSKRRFAQYVEPQNQKSPNSIDLSEGPRLQYDKAMGPKNLNFDIKIVDPYNY